MLLERLLDYGGESLVRVGTWSVPIFLILAGLSTLSPASAKEWPSVGTPVDLEFSRDRFEPQSCVVRETPVAPIAQMRDTARIRLFIVPNDRASAAELEGQLRDGLAKAEEKTTETLSVVEARRAFVGALVSEARGRHNNRRDSWSRLAVSTRTWPPKRAHETVEALGGSSAPEDLAERDPIISRHLEESAASPALPPFRRLLSQAERGDPAWTGMSRDYAENAIAVVARLLQEQRTRERALMLETRAAAISQAVRTENRVEDHKALLEFHPMFTAATVESSRAHLESIGETDYRVACWLAEASRLGAASYPADEAVELRWLRAVVANAPPPQFDAASNRRFGATAVRMREVQEAQTEDARIWRYAACIVLKADAAVGSASVVELSMFRAYATWSPRTSECLRDSAVAMLEVADDAAVDELYMETVWRMWAAASELNIPEAMEILLLSWLDDAPGVHEVIYPANALRSLEFICARSPGPQWQEGCEQLPAMLAEQENAWAEERERRQQAEARAGVNLLTAIQRIGVDFCRSNPDMNMCNPEAMEAVRDENLRYKCPTWNRERIYHGVNQRDRLKAQSAELNYRLNDCEGRAKRWRQERN
ncbi:hypothetical protein GC169_06615 [bacterium]|nr:hypothetical protein [bacterium]